MRIALAALIVLATSGCVTAPATMGSLPRERATECVANCQKLGMRLSAVVIISNSAGCVCEPTDAQAPAPRAGAAAVAGGAAIVAQSRQQRTQTGQPGGPMR